MNNDECICPTITIIENAQEKRTPCPVHEGFWRDGVYWRRCGDSDVSGGPYYVSEPPLKP